MRVFILLLHLEGHSPTLHRKQHIEFLLIFINFSHKSFHMERSILKCEKLNI